MPKKIIPKKGLFNHYLKDQPKNKPLKTEDSKSLGKSDNSSFQESKITRIQEQGKIKSKSEINIQEKEKSRNLEIKKYSNKSIVKKQDFKKSRNLENNKSNWKKVNIRMAEEKFDALKIYAVLNKIKLEDLFDNIISDFIKKHKK